MSDDTQSMSVRFPKDLHERLRRAAFDRREHMNSIVTRAVEHELSGKLAALRAAVQRVLDDEESGEGGWGPDVTCVSVLREAMDATSAHDTCKCGRPITRCAHGDMCEWLGWYHDQDRSHVCDADGRVYAGPGGAQ